VLACVTAILALWLLHDREYDFGERVRVHAEELGLGNPNRTRGGKKRSKRHPLEWRAAICGVLSWLGSSSPTSSR
jgi:hypothetical protein